MNELTKLQSCISGERLHMENDERIRQCDDCGAYVVLLGGHTYWSEADNEALAVMDAERQRLGTDDRHGNL